MSTSDISEIKIVLADDHEIVRAGIRRLLSLDKSITILDEVENGQELVEVVEYNRPDVVLSDIMMPVMNGIDATKKIRDKKIDTFVIMLTAYEDAFHLDKALKAGADGYLSKDISARKLIEAIKEVLKGERVFSRSVLKLINSDSSLESDPNAQPVVITKREQEILDLVALGKTSQDIADTLYISVRTVESHRYNLMQKLDVKNTAELIRYALTKKNQN